jgi:HlyD family secretion protein
MSRKNRSKLPVVLVAVVIVSALGYTFVPDEWLGREQAQALAGGPVRRGPLLISVTERGNLKAKDAISLRSEIEGRATILSLIAEGTFVDEGAVVAELDISDLLEKRVQQEITVANAEASHAKATEGLEIQKIENESLIARAELDLSLARTELEKYREGDWPQLEQEAEEEILIAEEELKQAESKRNYSQQLEEKGFLTRSELEGDELNYNRSLVKLEQSKRFLELLRIYEFPKQIATLQGDVDDKERELRKVKLQAESQLIDKETDLNAALSNLTLERERYEKLVSQIGKAVLKAPVAGMVVYGREEGGRWRGGDPMAEGTEVRERQEIISIPRAGGMVAEASIHESVLKQVEVGQSVILRVDAMPGREFNGTISYVAVLPDQNSWWANPNLRLYKTEVAIEDAVAEMRPGMSVSIEILVEQIEDTLYVPLQAVNHRNGKNLCFVSNGGVPEEREVVVGKSNASWVAIESGLREGETVLLSPPIEFLEAESDAEQNGDARPGRREDGVESSGRPSQPSTSETGDRKQRGDGAPEGTGRPSRGKGAGAGSAGATQ